MVIWLYSTSSTLWISAASDDIWFRLGWSSLGNNNARRPFSGYIVVARDTSLSYTDSQSYLVESSWVTWGDLMCWGFHFIIMLSAGLALALARWLVVCLADSLVLQHLPPSSLQKCLPWLVRPRTCHGSISIFVCWICWILHLGCNGVLMIWLLMVWSRGDTSFSFCK